MNWLKLLRRKSIAKKNNLVLRTDVPKTLQGYYFRYGDWSIVDFSWQKDSKHKKWYVEGVFAGWEAMDDKYHIYRADSLDELMKFLTP